MPVTGKLYDFTWENVDNAPRQHGVYVLYRSGQVTYIGRAAGSSVTIRSRLQSHKRGDEGSCTQVSAQYRREVTETAAARERQLMEEFVRVNGRLPSCNDRMP